MERIIVSDITDYLLRKKIIAKHQHGFIARKSTSTNLLEMLSDWRIAVDNKLTQTVIYVYFSKAFDSVCNAKLKTKLTGCGINGDLLNVIADFLTDRQQRTRVGQKLSNSCFLRSGICCFRSVMKGLLQLSFELRRSFCINIGFRACQIERRGQTQNMMPEYP